MNFLRVPLEKYIKTSYHVAEKKEHIFFISSSDTYIMKQNVDIRYLKGRYLYSIPDQYK